MSELLVLGGGPAGVAAAREGARRGARVTLVERAALGGTCVHGGCIPSGAYHRTADLVAELADAGTAGVTCGPPEVDWPRMHGWAAGVVDEAARLTRRGLESAGVEVLAGAARFTGPGAVEAAGRSFEGVPVVLAAGAVELPPELPVRSSCPVWGSAEAMAAERPPTSLVVVGAGRFGLEWADFFARLGSRVTVVEPGPRVLPDHDADVGGFLQLTLEERGVRFLIGGPLDEAAAAADAILSADRRAPSLEGLHLDESGATLDAAGAVEVDDRCRTRAPGLWAAGDVTGPPWLSNRARAMGVAAAAGALGEPRRVRVERLPRSVNTRPELAAVGLTEEEAAARGLQAATGFGELATSLRAITLGTPAGALKVVVDREFGEILGAHMIGVGATEVIAQVALAMELEADYRDLLKVHHLHPSLAELVTDAVASVE